MHGPGRFGPRGDYESIADLQPRTPGRRGPGPVMLHCGSVGAEHTCGALSWYSPAGPVSGLVYRLVEATPPGFWRRGGSGAGNGRTAAG